jgi:Alw26I/Eco31I/Esp3I family type II restriction m6 adenine DNA methyltransferase
MTGSQRRHHLDFVQPGASPDARGRTLYERAAGRFYTPDFIAADLASATITRLSPRENVKAVDPFCGDGRLIIAALRAAASSRPDLRRASWEIALWDLDQTAAVDAAEAVRAECDRLSISAIVSGVTTDSFDFASQHPKGFDLVVTNPPWDVLKPDRRELESMSSVQRDEYIRHLRAHSNLVARKYPRSEPEVRFSGWGINLARAGVELSLGLLSASGIAAVVSPASLFADQSSRRLRAWILEGFSLPTIHFYPAEARAFAAVDQAVTWFVASPDSLGSQIISVRRHDSDRKVVEDWTYVPTDTAKRGGAIPIHVFSASLDLIAAVSNFPTFGDLESDRTAGLWAGREFDETGLDHYVVANGGWPFLKGRSTIRYGPMPEDPFRILDPARKVPSSLAYERIAWRDVSRPSQARRVQATLVPAGWLTGNSVNVAYFRDQSSNRTLGLLGILNSDVVEAQARTLLATAHVSLGTIRECRVPRLDERLMSQLAPLVERRMRGDLSAEGDIEALIRLAYGLDKDVVVLAPNRAAGTSRLNGTAA